MRLIDLQPQFLQWRCELVPPGTTVDDVTYADSRVVTYHHVDAIADAQGVRFLCPKCFVVNGMQREGVHSVICWSSSRGTPDEARPAPGRWTLEGTGYNDLTLGCEPGKSRSVLLIGGCAWHGFVTNGEVTDA